MAFELELSDIPISRSSSAYSEDRITTVNSTGTLIHHQSHLRSLDGGTMQPRHRRRERILGPSSPFSLVDDGETIHAGRQGMDWNLDPIEEAEARRRWSAILARAETPISDQSLQYSNVSETVRAPLPEIEITDIGPRPSTPPLQRPRIHGLNYSSSILSRRSAAYSWTTVSENRISADFSRSIDLFQQDTPLRDVQSVDAIRPQEDASQYMLPPTFVRRDQVSRRAAQGSHQPQVGCPQPIYTLGRNSLNDSSSDICKEYMDEILSLREAFAPTPPAVRHHMGIDRYGGVVVDTIMEQPEQQSVSAPESYHGSANLKPAT